MLLLDLELRLQSFEKELSEFGLPVPTVEELEQVESVTSIEAVVIREERVVIFEGIVATQWEVGVKI